MSTERTTSEQAQRLGRMVEILAGHVVQGLSNKDLTAAMRTSPVNVTRTARELIAMGWAEKDETTGRFRLTTKFSRLTFKVRDAFARERASLEELERNYTLNH